MSLWTCPLLRHRQSLIPLPLGLFCLPCNQQHWPVEVMLRALHVLVRKWNAFLPVCGSTLMGACCQGSYMPWGHRATKQPSYPRWRDCRQWPWNHTERDPGACLLLLPLPIPAPVTGHPSLLSPPESEPPDRASLKFLTHRNHDIIKWSFMLF